MKVKFFPLLLIIISGVQAISNEDFHINFTSEDKNLIQTNEQAHHFNGNLDGNGKIEVSTRLNHEIVTMKSNNEHRHRHGLSVFIRKGGIGGGGGIGRGAAAGVLGAGVIGGSSVYDGTHHSNNSATPLSAWPHVCVSTFILCLSFWV